MFGDVTKKSAIDHPKHDTTYYLTVISKKSHEENKILIQKELYNKIKTNDELIITSDEKIYVNGKYEMNYQKPAYHKSANDKDKKENDDYSAYGIIALISLFVIIFGIIAINSGESEGYHHY